MACETAGNAPTGSMLALVGAALELDHGDLQHHGVFARFGEVQLPGRVGEDAAGRQGFELGLVIRLAKAQLQRAADDSHEEIAFFRAVRLQLLVRLDGDADGFGGEFAVVIQT